MGWFGLEGMHLIKELRDEFNQTAQDPIQPGPEQFQGWESMGKWGWIFCLECEAHPEASRRASTFFSTFSIDEQRHGGFFFFPNSNILKLQLEFPEQIWLPVPTTQQIPVILNCSSSRERPKNPNQSQPTRILGWEICQINLFHWGWRAPKQRGKCTLKAKLGQGY